MIKQLLTLTSISGALAVMAGAFGAHSLKNQLSESLLSAYKTGVYYQLFHTLALLILASLMMAMHFHTSSTPDLKHLQKNFLKRLKLTAIFWLVGIVLFSGSLYGLAIGGPKWLGPITPIGGLCLMLGWLTLAFSAARSRDLLPSS